jgi:hypothetical protein
VHRAGATICAILAALIYLLLGPARGVPSTAPVYPMICLYRALQLAANRREAGGGCKVFASQFCVGPLYSNAPGLVVFRPGA